MKVLKIVLINVLVMVLLAILIPFLTLNWLDDYTHHDQAYAVPDVCGLSLEEAKNVLADSKLDYAVLEYKHKEGAAENEVIEQRPLADAKVKEGRKIVLVLNTTRKPKQGLPPIVDNCSLREAKFRLAAAGFVVEKVDTIDGERDWVYELLYEGRKMDNGTAIPRGSKVTLVIGSGERVLEDTVMLDSNFF